MSKSSQKGAEGEREFARVIGGKKTSIRGLPTPDVTGPDGTTYEVKRRAKSFTTIYNAYAQTDGVDVVAIRDNYKPWMIVVPLGEWLRLKELDNGK